MQPLDCEVLPTFEAHGATIDAILSDNGREFCGRPDRHPYELFLQLEGIAHRTTRVAGRSPTASSSASTAPCSTSICASRAGTWYETLDEMQAALDAYL